MACLCSCSEDDILADYKDVTEPFRPTDDDHSEEAELRRSFFAEHGSYLLFNDTLQHRALGYDANGEMQYFTELIDITYVVGGQDNTSNKYTYTLISSFETEKIGVEYLEQYILPRLTGKLKPFSWFLADKITREFSGNKSNPYAVSGQRSIAIATNLLPRLTDAQKVQYTNQVLNRIIGKLASDNSDAFSEFFKISNSYYSGTFTAPSTNAENTAILANVGFITKGEIAKGIEANGCYPSRDADLQSYARTVIANSQETIRKKYADYPLVIRKSEIVYQVLTSLGYKE